MVQRRSTEHNGHLPPSVTDASRADRRLPRNAEPNASADPPYLANRPDIGRDARTLATFSGTYRTGYRRAMLSKRV